MLAQRLIPPAATPDQLWQCVEAAWTKDTSITSLILCRGMWQWLQPAMAVTDHIILLVITTVWFETSPQGGKTAVWQLYNIHQNKLELSSVLSYYRNYANVQDNLPSWQPRFCVCRTR
ncbi:hypothetical protein TNCV_4142011 [Trichonephila clavipes]|nr:hypothetical protein TNCV_4142011 [Trichonephila clavipes]